MKRSLKSALKRPARALLIILLCAFTAACGGSSQESRKEDIREKLLLAYQYLENMEYDSALDAFASIIEIDEKQAAAYIGMARAYSAQGKQKEARDTALGGFEATGNETLEGLGRNYTRITEHEKELKELADLLQEGGEKIPSELEESRSGLFSETLDRLWEALDQSDIYEYGTDVLVYPVDPENGIYLLLYPDGHFYLGKAVFTPYSELLAQEEARAGNGGENTEGAEGTSYEGILLILPDREEYGVWAGIDLQEDTAGFYVGKWKDGMPEDKEGFYVYQDLSANSRFVYYGIVGKARLQQASAYYGSTDPFLDVILGLREADRSLRQEIAISKVIPFDRGLDAMMSPVTHAPGHYSSDFENRALFEEIEKEGTERLARERRLQANHADSPVPAGGDLYYLSTGGYTYDFNTEHGLTIIMDEGKESDHTAKVINDAGQVLFRGHADMLWFTDTGFRGALVTEPGTDTPDDSYIFWGSSDEKGDVYEAEFDWEGREISREYVGPASDTETQRHFYGRRKRNAVNYYENSVAPGSLIRAERRSGGIYVTDLEGNEKGALYLDAPEEWVIEINGRTIKISRYDTREEYLFMAVK